MGCIMWSIVARLRPMLCYAKEELWLISIVQLSPDNQLVYRVTLVVAYLGWVDLEFNVRQMGVWQNWLGRWAR